MSSNKYDQVMEDKYAKKSMSFATNAPQNNDRLVLSSKTGPRYEGDITKDVLTSDIQRQKELDALNKPKGLIARKIERIFGALGDVQK